MDAYTKQYPTTLRQWPFPIVHLLPKMQEQKDLHQESESLQAVDKTLGSISLLYKLSISVLLVTHATSIWVEEGHICENKARTVSPLVGCN